MKVDIRYLPLVGLLTIPLGFSIGYMSQENSIDRFELVTVPIYNPPNIVLTVPEPEVIIQTVLETETVVETVIETETVVEIQITDSPVLTAIQYVGLNERTDRRELTDLLGVDPTRVAWCAAFVNIILDQHNITGTGSLLAQSFLEFGTEVDSPKVGDIVIFERGDEGWQGHVGFYINTVKEGGVEYYKVLGGNQRNNISFELYPVRKLLGIRRI